MTDYVQRTFSVTYQAHVKEKGWLGFVKEGEMAGTTGEARQIEAIEIMIIRNK